MGGINQKIPELVIETPMKKIITPKRYNCMNVFFKSLIQITNPIITCKKPVNIVEYILQKRASSLNIG
jgi:hypothetical protein